MNFDHYKVAKELANELRKENLNDYADKIIESMEQGSTGTEIFMALRWSIGNLLNAKNYPYSKAIRDKATCLFEELDKALQ